MLRLRFKLSLFSLLSKVVFTGLFLVLMPLIVERIGLIQTDNKLIQMREQVIGLISELGIEPFITSDTGSDFGSYNILKDEFISLERYYNDEDLNYIDISDRLIDSEDITYRILNYTLKVDGRKYLLEVGRSLDSIRHTERNIRGVMLLFLSFIILITFFTDLLYTRRLLKPLDSITAKLKNISDPSVYDKNPVSTSTSDFMSLDNALKELMERIDKLFSIEKQSTINISHELITPVSVLRSKLENLLVSKGVTTEISERIGESLKTLHRLQTLINSLLMIARIESHQYLKNESINVNDVLSEIISELDPLISDAGIILKKEFRHDLYFNKGNRSLLFSMFYNILNNALKNTPKEGVVTIESFITRGIQTVRIADSGKGISVEQMGNLFSRFKTRTSEAGNGTGIGLAIAKSIADFHEIVVKVGSEINKGSVFTFIFPENSS